MSSQTRAASALVSKCKKFSMANRNPRNTELQRAKAKIRGFQTSKEDLSFFNRVRFFQSNQHLSATVDSPGGDISLNATTQEYNLQRFLYSYTSTTTARELAKVMAQRLKESGISAVFWDGQEQGYRGKSKIFIDTLRKEGIATKE